MLTIAAICDGKHTVTGELPVCVDGFTRELHIE
jgi:hypothetical protein